MSFLNQRLDAAAWIKTAAFSASLGLAAVLLLLRGSGLAETKWGVLRLVPVPLLVARFLPGFLFRIVANRRSPVLRIGQHPNKLWAWENLPNLVAAGMVAVSLSGFWVILYSVGLGRAGTAIGIVALMSGVSGVLGALIDQDFGFIWRSTADMPIQAAAAGGGERPWIISSRSHPASAMFSSGAPNSAGGNYRRLTALAGRCAQGAAFLPGLLPPLVFAVACSLAAHAQSARGRGLKLSNLAFLSATSSFIIVVVAAAAVLWIKGRLSAVRCELCRERLLAELPFAVFAAALSAFGLLPFRGAGYFSLYTMAITFVVSEAWLFRVLFIYSRTNVPAA